MSTPTEEKVSPAKCQMCDREFKGLRGLANHIRQAHNITIACYYDTYIDPDTGKCLTCYSQTSFHNIVKGYRDFCSIVCAHRNKDLSKQKVVARLETYRKDPTIMQRLLAKRVQTLSDDPSIILNRDKRIAETIRQNPYITEARTRRRKETFASDPSIQSNATKKSQFARSSPEAKARISKNISIGLREYYTSLKQSSSTIPCVVYIIEHIASSIVKIGITSNLDKRFKELKKDFGPVKTIRTVETTHDKASILELKMHKRFKEHCRPQSKGSGKTEWFSKCIEASALTMLEEFESTTQV